MFSKSTELKSGKPRDGRHCDLCGSSNPVVKCEKCNSQLFCLSCDDMYHRHPRRKTHNRKAVDSLVTLTRKPPPVHAPLADVPEVEGQPISRPVAPPRKKRFHSFLNKGPSLPKKELSWSERLHSLKRFMGGRPLPPTPSEQMAMHKDQRIDLPPLPSRNPIQSAFNHPVAEDASTLPVPVVEMGMAAAAQQNQRMLNRSLSLRRPPGDRSQNRSLHGSGGLPTSGSWDHLHQYQHDQSQENPGGFAPHPYFGHPMMSGAMNQSVSVADLQTLMHHQHGELGPHMGGHMPHMGFGPAQSMSHLNCAQCMAMTSMWHNPHMMNACNACHHHSMAAMSDTLRSHRHGGSSTYLETDGGVSTGRHTPLSRRAPSVPRSVASNRSRRSHRRTISVDESQMRPVEKVSAGGRWTPQMSRKRISSESSDSESESDEEELQEASEKSDESESSDEEEDEEEEEDERNEGVGVSKDENAMKNFDQEWQCEHCTYINQPNTRVCGVCCKTSENPYLLKPPKKAASPPRSHKGSASVKSKTLTRDSSLERHKKNRISERTNSLRYPKKSKEESRTFPRKRQDSPVIANEQQRVEQSAKPLSKTPVSKSEGKSHKSVRKDFEYRSFKPISRKSSLRKSIEKESDARRTSESSALSEPLYMNEQEVADAKDEYLSSDLPIENLYINESAKALQRDAGSRIDSEISTSASEDVRSDAKKSNHILKRKKKLASRQQKSKESAENSTEDEKKVGARSRTSKGDKPPPRPKEAKPGLSDKGSAAGFLNKNLPPPPSFDDQKAKKSIPEPSPIIPRKSKPRLATPPSEAYRSARKALKSVNDRRPSSNSESAEIKDILTNAALRKPPTPEIGKGTLDYEVVNSVPLETPSIVTKAPDFLKAQQEAERAIMEQQHQNEELKNFRMMQKNETSFQQHPVALKAEIPQGAFKIPDSLFAEAPIPTFNTVVQPQQEFEINQSLPKSSNSSRNSFSSTVSSFAKNNVSAPLQPLAVEQPFPIQPIAPPPIASPLSDTTEDFRSTCTSPTYMQNDHSVPTAFVPAPANFPPDQQGLLAIVAPKQQIFSAPVPMQTVINPSQTKPVHFQHQAPMNTELVQPVPVQGNQWPVNVAQPQALPNSISQPSVIKPPASSHWSNPPALQQPIPQAPWGNFNQAAQNPPPEQGFMQFSQDSQNIWAPKPHQSMNQTLPQNNPVPIQQQSSLWPPKSSTGFPYHEDNVDAFSRRQSQPQVVNYNSGQINWNNDPSQMPNLRRSYSQTSLSRAGHAPWNLEPPSMNGSSMYRSTSRTSLMSDGHAPAGLAQSMMDVSPSHPDRYGRDLFGERDERDRHSDWTTKGFSTLPRNIRGQESRYEKEKEHDRNVKRRDYYLSMEELVQKRKQDSLRQQGFELVKLLREAEKSNFTAEDLQVALNHCGSKQNPIQWLQDNWKNMVETVVTLATNYGHDKRDNDVGILSNEEAKEALRLHLGNVWAAVTKCVENRQRKVNELMIRGGFSKKEVVVALSSNNGDMEEAFDELTKTNAQPFQMKIWGSGSGNDCSDAAAKREDEDSDGEYKPASDTFSIFSAPKDLKHFGLKGQLDESERRKNDDLKEIKALLPDDIKPELIRSHQAYLEEDDALDEEEAAAAVGDESITQWLIRDSRRPRVKVETNEEKKLKSVEMIRAALNENKAPEAEGAAAQEPIKEQSKPRAKSQTPPKKLDADVKVMGATKDEEIKPEPELNEPKEGKQVEENEPKAVKVVPKPKGNKAALERKVRMLLAEGKCETYEQAETASRLLDMMFSEEQALTASKECADVYQALNYLHQDCELCVAQYPAAQMVSMIHCTHRACQHCAKTYFTLQIRDRNIMEAKCPFCDEPDLTDEEVAQDYFNHLDRLLKTLVDENTYELFQRKLRDRVLMDDPNFKWCSQCSSGFIANPNLKKLVCPDCRSVMCGKCLLKWEEQHQGLTCEKFKEWKELNDPEHQAAGVDKHLEEHGIQCPKCKFKFSLARGGCMHYKCTQCQFEFCSGCGKPFKMGAKCGKAAICARLGLHAHHPRNCLFYLRDKEPEDLQKLLKEKNIEFKTEVEDEDNAAHKKCMVMEQKETDDGLKDEPCNKDIEEAHAGYCRTHYIEYLGGLITKNNVDPLILMNEDELELILKRAEVRLPLKPWREKPDQYRKKLLTRIEDVLPLEREIAA